MMRKFSDFCEEKTEATEKLFDRSDDPVPSFPAKKSNRFLDWFFGRKSKQPEWVHLPEKAKPSQDESVNIGSVGIRDNITTSLMGGSGGSGSSIYSPYIPVPPPQAEVVRLVWRKFGGPFNMISVAYRQILKGKRVFSVDSYSDIGAFRHNLDDPHLLGNLFKEYREVRRNGRIIKKKNYMGGIVDIVIRNTVESFAVQFVVKLKKEEEAKAEAYRNRY